MKNTAIRHLAIEYVGYARSEPGVFPTLCFEQTWEIKLAIFPGVLPAARRAPVPPLTDKVLPKSGRISVT